MKCKTNIFDSTFRILYFYFNKGNKAVGTHTEKKMRSLGRFDCITERTYQNWFKK